MVAPTPLPPGAYRLGLLTASRSIGLLGAGAVLLADGLGLSRSRSRPVAGLFDELAHLGTGLVVLAAWPGGRAYEKGLLAGSILLDVDHVPELVGVGHLRTSGLRPFPHSAATVSALALARHSRRLRHGPRDALAGGIAGVVAHLVRDLATGTNAVPLLWPLSRRPVTIRYRTYAAALAAVAGAGAAPRRP